jgi:hypothetical protein
MTVSSISTLSSHSELPILINVGQMLTKAVKVQKKEITPDVSHLPYMFTEG